MLIGSFLAEKKLEHDSELQDFFKKKGIEPWKQIISMDIGGAINHLEKQDKEETKGKIENLLRKFGNIVMFSITDALDGISKNIGTINEKLESVALDLRIENRRRDFLKLIRNK
ncbi:MAG: hypothetical protein GF370_04915 [Candidatus Nealsonbacteria bacterium]|nr:hypothetical protein [Candidatus Nealsonbacteria bacterium]